MGKLIDKNEFWFYEGTPISKAGVFQYLGKQISSDLEPNKIYNVYRPLNELNNKNTIESFKLLPLVDGHGDPKEKELHGTSGENVYFQGDKLKADLKVFSNDLQDTIANGKKEISIGYACRYEKKRGQYQGQPFDYIQRDIRGNHIALVEKGRSGEEVAVFDSKISNFDLLSKDMNNDNLVFVCDTAEDLPEVQKITEDFDESKVNRDKDGRFSSNNSSFHPEIKETIKGIIKKGAHNLETINKEIKGLYSFENEQEEALKKMIENELFEATATKEEKYRRKIDILNKYYENKDKKQVKTNDEGEHVDKEELKDLIKGLIEEALSKKAADEEELKKKETEDLAKKESETKEQEEMKKKEEEKKAEDTRAEVMKEIAKRDELYSKVSKLTGDFDKSMMSSKEVAKYACDHLKLTCDDGAEVATIQGYLAAHKPAGVITMANDKADVFLDDDAEFNNYLGGK
jgi:hypothetical protein